MTVAARARWPVRIKIISVVLVTTTLALLFAGVAMLTHDLTVYRRAWASDIETQAGIVARATAPALAFEDRDAARRNLAALAARPAVLAAALYRVDGSRFATWVTPGHAAAPMLQPADPPTTRIRGDRLEVWLPVTHDSERLGTIYLRATYEVRERVVAYLGIFAVVMLAGMGCALVTSAALARLITDPLDSIADVARRVVGNRDYALRARKRSDDELGVVVDAFNTMLDEVQQRTLALERANAALTVEVNTRQVAEAALARANARLESSMAAAEIGSWVHDYGRDVITMDRNLAALCGLDAPLELSGSPSLLQRHVHPDDLALVRGAEEEALANGTLYSPAFRIVRPDGAVRWVVARGKVQLLAGRPVLLAGLLLDVTAQKTAETALIRSERLYRAIGESIDYGVWICDDNGRHVYASDSFLRLTGMSQAACADSGWAAVLHPDDAAATLEAWHACVREESPWYREHRVRGVDGAYHPVLAIGVPVRDERGRVSGWAGLNLDISRLKRTEEALREADRRKDEFLATLAHELRNPLAPIRHAVRLLDGPAADPARREWARDVIARQVHRMALLLDDLLDVSRITRGYLALKKSRVRLDTLTESALETARPLIEARQQRLEVDLDDPTLVLEVDALRLSQALSNLLTNAAKYTDAGGSIIVTARHDARGLRISVRDSGIGLSTEALSQVFEIFTQVGSAIDRAEGGLGIGLALVRGLVTLHGGTVSAHSAGLGQGSEFSIRMPASCVVAAQVDEGAAPRTIAQAAPGCCRVLLVDDNQDAADTLALVLESHGHTTCVAYTGEDGIAQARTHGPQVVVLDIGLPDLTGYEVARALRAEPACRAALLLAVTGWGQDADRQRALDAGFDHHLTKPVDADRVQQLIVAHLATRAATVVTLNAAAK